jgi:hypothetical protein
LTSTINSICYFKEIENFVNENKNKMIKRFGAKNIAKDMYSSITFSINLTKFETHNSGKSPAYVTFKHNDRDLFKIVWKPRDAKIDKAVIRAFKKINKLKSIKNQTKLKSDDVDLPYYKIWIPSDKNNISIWEYVEGDDVPSKPRNVKMFLEQELAINEPARLAQARQTLLRLDAILSRMNISDLHNENLKIKHFKDKHRQIQIIPIDLENRQKGEGTQLGIDSRSFKLTEAEEKIIDKYFTKKVTSISYRYIPMKTQNMMGLTNDYRECHNLAKMLMKRFEQDKLQIKCSLMELTIFLVKTFFNNDVPYFTNKEGKIYYGLPEHRNLIAEEGGK